MDKNMNGRRVYGYTRVSTDQQRLERGIADVELFCEKKGYKLHEMVTDKFTGKVFERSGYTRLRNDLLREGDILIVPEATRLGRTADLIKKELIYFKDNGIWVIILDIPTTTRVFESEESGMEKLIMDMISSVLIEVYSMMAETELMQKEKRQKEGMQQAAVRAHLEIDEWKSGRPNLVEEEKFKDIYIKYNLGDKHRTKKEKTEIRLQVQEELGISRTTYNKYLKCMKTGLPFRNINYEKWLPEKYANENGEQEGEEIRGGS